MAVVVTCNNCKLEFEINSSQEAKGVFLRFLFGKVPGNRWYQSRCPFCGHTNENRSKKEIRT